MADIFYNPFRDIFATGAFNNVFTAGSTRLPNRADLIMYAKAPSLVDSIGVSGVTKLKNSLDGTDGFTVYGYAADLVGTEVFTCASITGATVTGQSGTAVVAVGSGQLTVTTPGTLAWFTLDSGEKYVLQSGPDYDQDTFFDINGIGDNLVLNEGTGTVPLCTAEVEGSLLLAYGFDDRTPIGAELAYDSDFDGLVSGAYYWRLSEGCSIADGEVTIQQVDTENQYISDGYANIDLGDWHRVIIDVTELSPGGIFALCDGSGGNFAIDVPVIDKVGIYAVDIYGSASVVNIGVKRYPDTPAGSKIVLNSFSLFKLLDAAVPTNPATGLSVSSGLAPAISAFGLHNCPILLAAIPVAGWFDSDTRYGTGQYFEVDTTPKIVATANVEENFENAEFFDNNKILIYASEQDYITAGKISKYLKSPETLFYIPRVSAVADPTSVRIGFLADTHYRTDAEADQGPIPTRNALLVMDIAGVNGVTHLGDIYHGSYTWYTDEQAQTDIETYERLFRGMSSDNVLFVTGNHDANVAGSYTPLWTYSAYAAKNRVITVGNYDFISLFDVNGASAPYASDAESTTFLTDALAASLSNNRGAFVCVHAPLKLTGIATETLAEIITILSDAISAGTKVRGIFAGHIHVWESISDFENLLIPMITIESVSYQGSHYYLDVEPESFVVTKVADGAETAMGSYHVIDTTNLIDDGDFATAGQWVGDGGWEVTGGVAWAHNFTASYKRLSRPFTFELGETYRISGVCTEYSGTGQAYLRKPRDVSIPDSQFNISGTGEFHFTVTIGSDNDEIAFANNSTGVDLKIDDIVVLKLS